MIRERFKSNTTQTQSYLCWDNLRLRWLSTTSISLFMYLKCVYLYGWNIANTHWKEFRKKNLPHFCGVLGVTPVGRMTLLHEDDCSMNGSGGGNGGMELMDRPKGDCMCSMACHVYEAKLGWVHLSSLCRYYIFVWKLYLHCNHPSKKHCHV